MSAEALLSDDLYEIEQALKAASVCGGLAVLRQAHALLAGRLAIVSSFGAESAILLALVAEIDTDLPVIFLQTGMHFTETLEYRAQLTSHLGLTRVHDVAPTTAARTASDPHGGLWHFDPDACCRMRKVIPLAEALRPFDAWVSGQKRHQAATRRSLSAVERDGSRIKVNPLADWDSVRIEAEMVRRALPRHPLVSAGYPSIGCGPCTARVAEGADPRSGRWAGSLKVECGIHRPLSVVA